MKKLFSQEGFLWRSLNTLTDIFVLSTMWLFLSIPIITSGAATTALYDSVIHCVRYKESGPCSRFCNTFKNGLAVNIFTMLLWSAVIALGLLILNYFRGISGLTDSAVVAAAAYYIIMLIPIGAACWVFPIMSRFTFGFSALNTTALKLCISFLPRTIILVLLTIEAGRFCLKWIFPFFFIPAVLMLLWSLFIEPVFDKYNGGLKKSEDENRAQSED